MLECLEDRCLPAVSLQGVMVNATQGTAFNGTVATLTDTVAGATPANFSGTINWGDGTTSPMDGQTVSIVADPTVAGQFDVMGMHTFAATGSFNVQVTVTDMRDGSMGTTAFFSETNLVTDNQTVLASLGFAPAAHVDPQLVNPWGVAFGPGGPFWVGNNGSGVSTLYDGGGNKQSLVVTIPASMNPGATSPAPITGVVFNGTSDFNLNPTTGGPPTAPAIFLFVTEDGTLAGWNSGTAAVLKVDDADFTNGPVYKGLALGNNGTQNLLYATNFRNRTIDVFDTNFHKITLTGGFNDPGIPSNFAPFGIQNINGQLFVTYAMQNAAKHDDVAGAGNGFVDVFDTNGNFVRRLASNGTLNSPWGVALAPSTFGAFAGDLLVGNFGDGHISAFNPSTGAFLGQLMGANNQPVAIDGLWNIGFGNNGAAGSASTLFFTAGINGEMDGLFGSLSAVEGSKATVTAPGPTTTASVFAVGAGPGGLPMVNVYNAATGAFMYQFQAFETGFTGGVRVAAARNAAGQDIIAVAAGPGGFLVRTFVAGPNGVTPIGQFLPFGGFTGGIFVALGDLNGDGNLEVVTGPDAAPNSNPFINVWNLQGTTQLSPNAFAFEQGFTGGVRVAVGDVDGDGHNEIIASAGPSGLPLVQVLNGQTFQKETRFQVFGTGFTGGVFVTAAVLDSSGLARLVVSADGADGSAGNEPVLREFDAAGNMLHDFVFALESTYHGGVDVMATRAFGRSFDSILAGPVRAHPPTVSVLSETLTALPNSFTVMDSKTMSPDSKFSNGLDVG
jgi:uncharacterized protein (TIGR03118 family)